MTAARAVVEPPPCWALPFGKAFLAAVLAFGAWRWVDTPGGLLARDDAVSAAGARGDGAVRSRRHRDD